MKLADICDTEWVMQMQVKWVKLCTDIFDDEKILLIESMPDADSIIVIWFKLLCFAGKQNNGGVFLMNDRIAYTDEMLSTIFRRPLSVVRMALKTFESFGMVEIINNAYTIPNWEKHQSLDAYEKKKQKDRERIAQKRAEKKALIESSTEMSHDNLRQVAECRIVEKDKERDKDLDKRNNYQLIADMYNEICISFPRLTSLSEKRKQAIKARLNTYSVDKFREMFTKAESSAFLKGKNSCNWSATFDWMLKDANFAKILDGNYDDAKPAEIKSDASYDIDAFRNESLFGELKYERKKK